MQWVSCASSRLTVWLQGLKVRDLSSTPVSRAILETSCSGIRLQTWRKRLNRQRVGLIVFFFFIPAVWQVQNVKPTLFFIFCGMAVSGVHFCSIHWKLKSRSAAVPLGARQKLSIKECGRRIQRNALQTGVVDRGASPVVQSRCWQARFQNRLSCPVSRIKGNAMHFSDSKFVVD